MSVIFNQILLAYNWDQFFSQTGRWTLNLQFLASLIHYYSRGLIEKQKKRIRKLNAIRMVPGTAEDFSKSAGQILLEKLIEYISIEM